jgi:hypothetical protein
MGRLLAILHRKTTLRLACGLARFPQEHDLTLDNVLIIDLANSRAGYRDARDHSRQPRR